MSGLTQPTMYLGDGMTIQSFSDNTQLVTLNSSCALELNSSPINSNHAVNKEYVDSQISLMSKVDATSISVLNSLFSNYSSKDAVNYTSLSTSISELKQETTSSITSLSSSIVSLSSEMKTLTVTNIEDNLRNSISNLSTSTSTAITNLKSINSQQINEITSLYSCITDTSNNLSTSIISLSSIISSVRNSVQTYSIVLLNSVTINNGSAYPVPRSKYPIQEDVMNKNGWYYVSTNKGGINWTLNPLGSDGMTKLKISDISQIYFTLYFNKITPSYLVPQLYLYYDTNSYISFKPVGINCPLNPGTYTFIANFNTIFGNTNIINNCYNNDVGKIINLTNDNSNSSSSNLPTVSNIINNIKIRTPNIQNINNYGLAVGTLGKLFVTNNCGISYTSTNVSLSNILGTRIFYTPSTNSNFTYYIYGQYTSASEQCVYSSSNPNNGYIGVGGIFGTSSNGNVNCIEYNTKYNTNKLILIAGGTSNRFNRPLSYSTNGTKWNNFTSTHTNIDTNDIVYNIMYNYNTNKWLVGTKYVSDTGKGSLYYLTISTSGLNSIFKNPDNTTISTTVDTVASQILNNEVRYITSNYSNNFFVAVGSSSSTPVISIITSSSGDAGNWVACGSGIFNIGAYCVEYNGNMWLVGGTGGNTFAYSYDGINWTGIPYKMDTCPLTSVTSIVWNGLTWVACGSGDTKLAYSYNGITWIGITNTSLPSSINCVASTYPDVYQFLLSNLFLETDIKTNIAGGTMNYIFNDSDVTNNYQYNVLNKLINSLYKRDLYSYADPLEITTI